ncbi:PREDICTED: geminin-like [Polistes dominula]|uniref:Geminin-like n=1 Tax=Polistes dominula TaxID=743375 RepID=A0ABM1J8E6_POLDO|nr:PREDICTED: geminin-like [Polistes dominula]
MKPASETKVLASKTSISEPESTEKGILSETEINVTTELPFQDTVKKDIRNISEKVKNEIHVKAELPLQDTIKKYLDVKDTSVKSKKESIQNKNYFYKKDKAVQTSREELIRIDIEDLTSEAGPSENYWQVLAERRRIALDEALDENKALHERIVTLQEENRLCNEMLNETRTLVEVLQEMIGDDDSNGIHNSLEDSAL